MNNYLIKSGRIIDPSQKIDSVGDLLILDGIVAEIRTSNSTWKDLGEKLNREIRIIDVKGNVVCPGFVDAHCHLREPGFEHKETISSGTKAAAKGGYTTICAMPNTEPVMDSSQVVEFVLNKAKSEGVVKVNAIAAISVGSLGAKLTQMKELFDSGVKGFSDDGNPVNNPKLMEQALLYSSMLDLPIINHCEVLELTNDASVNEGFVSDILGVKGISSASEEIMVARDILLAKDTGGKLHIAHASTSGTVQLVELAKEQGVDVTCEVTPHHLTISDEIMLGNITDINSIDGKSSSVELGADAYMTNAKVSPPLRSVTDIEALISGIKSGIVDFIATDHAPHSNLDKFCTLDDAANGISGLETSLGLSMMLFHKYDVPLSLLVDKLSLSPSKVLKLNSGTLKVGASADVTIFDPNKEWVVKTNEFISKGKNSPIEGFTLKGQVLATLVEGKIVYSQIENNVVDLAKESI